MSSLNPNASEFVPRGMMAAAGTSNSDAGASTSAPARVATAEDLSGDHTAVPAMFDTNTAQQLSDGTINLGYAAYRANLRRIIYRRFAEAAPTSGTALLGPTHELSGGTTHLPSAAYGVNNDGRISRPFYYADAARAYYGDAAPYYGDAFASEYDSAASSSGTALRIPTHELPGGITHLPSAAYGAEHASSISPRLYYANAAPTNYAAFAEPPAGSTLVVPNQNQELVGSIPDLASVAFAEPPAGSTLVVPNQNQELVGSIPDLASVAFASGYDTNTMGVVNHGAASTSDLTRFVTTHELIDGIPDLVSAAFASDYDTNTTGVVNHGAASTSGLTNFVTTHELIDGFPDFPSAAYDAEGSSSRDVDPAHHVGQAPAPHGTDADASEYEIIADIGKRLRETLKEEGVDLPYHKTVSGSFFGNAMPITAATPATKVPPRVVKQGDYKTELCFRWATTGRCHLGRKCRFAHGESEVRHVLRSRNYRTELCLYGAGRCPFGHRCMFLH
ncbi:hypothetical protein ACQ4PT_046902 [Festuca glaucescens]